MHNRNSKIYNNIGSKVHFKGLWYKELMNTLLALIALQMMEQHNKQQYYMNNSELCKRKTLSFYMFVKIDCTTNADEGKQM